MLCKYAVILIALLAVVRKLIILDLVEHGCLPSAGARRSHPRAGRRLLAGDQGQPREIIAAETDEVALQDGRYKS